MSNERAEWLRPITDGVVEIRVYVAPRASRSRVVGMHAGALKIQLAAAPVEGAANRELLEFLARQLCVAKSRLEISFGVNSRKKAVRIQGLSVEEIEKLLSND